MKRHRASSPGTAARPACRVTGQCGPCCDTAVPEDCPTHASPADTPSSSISLHTQGEVLLVRQNDQPGIIATVASELAKKEINISFMSVGRTGRGADAIMAIGIDGSPDKELLGAISSVRGVQETAALSNLRA